MPDSALVVGVERYGLKQAPDVPGSAFDAMRFALWLRDSQGVPASNIRLFCNRFPNIEKQREEEYDALWTQLQDSGVKASFDISREAIMAAFENDLPKSGNGTVWIFWAGHGVTLTGDRDCLLCHASSSGSPAFISLQELREALRSEPFRAFPKQRIIIDACRQYIDPSRLGLQKDPGFDRWSGNQDREQIEISAVPRGKLAELTPQGGIFTSVLLDLLNKKQWPEDMPAFYEKLRSGVSALVGNKEAVPSVRILSPSWNQGYEFSTNKALSQEVMDLLLKCPVAFHLYRPLYVRTVARLAHSKEAMQASSIPEMVSAMVDLAGDPLYRNLPHALVEFLARVHRKYPDDTKPIRQWLNRLPAGSLQTLEAELAMDVERLVLRLEVSQIDVTSQTGYPARLTAMLTDTSRKLNLAEWRRAGADASVLKRQEDLIQETRDVLTWASQRDEDSQGIDVHVCTDIPFFSLPWQKIPIDPMDVSETFSEHCGFALRWRERSTRKNSLYAPKWHERSTKLRAISCREIPVMAAPSPDQTCDLNDHTKGLLFFADTIAPSPREGTSAAEQLLVRALKCGLSFATWCLHDDRGAAQRQRSYSQQALENFLEENGNATLEDVTTALLKEREHSAWAREAVLFLDLADPRNGRGNFRMSEAIQV